MSSTYSAGVDALANLLDGPRGRGAMLLRTIMAPPWSVRMRDEAPLGLVAMLQGEMWVVPDDGTALHLRPGAVALVKGRYPVTFADDPTTRPQIVFHPGGRCTTPRGEEFGDTLELGVRTWGNDPEGSTVMLLGCYQVRGEVSQRVLDALPPQLVLGPETWSSPLVQLLADEIVSDEPGQQAVLDRLFDLLLVTVVRAWFDQPEAEVPGWYSGHDDPVVGETLRLLHENPSQPWTVASLAARTGVSRAALARSFVERVGVPPMTYLKQWRMAVAADLLLESGNTLDVIAHQVGYSDGFALSTVFKRVRGLSPQQYREAVAAS
jgi:AraC-like DNA-binding protein